MGVAMRTPGRRREGRSRGLAGGPGEAQTGQRRTHQRAGRGASEGSCRLGAKGGAAGSSERLMKGRLCGDTALLPAKGEGARGGEGWGRGWRCQ